MDRETLITQHISLARALANKFYNQRRNSHLDLDEYVGAAMLGLCEAAKSFNPEAGSKFAAYAYLRIRGAMYDLVRSTGTIPRSMFAELSAESSNVKYKMARDLAELESLKTIIEEYGLKLVFGNDEMPEVTYHRELSPEQATVIAEAREYLRELIENLPHERKQVVSHYYYEDKNYREIEPLMKASSKSWISRLHKSALASLKKSIESNSMKWDLLSAYGIC